MGSGLVNALIGYAAAPKNQNLGLGRILASAAQSGLQGARGVYDTATQDIVTQQRLAEMQRNQQQEVASREAIDQLLKDPKIANDPMASAFIRANPTEAIKFYATPAESPVAKIDPKDYTPESIAEYRQTGDVASLRALPKDVTPTTLDKLIATRDNLIANDPNNPNISFYNKAIQKEIDFAPAPSTTINVGGSGVAPKKIDEKFADQFIDWTVGGGFADVQKSLTQLETAISSLENSPEGTITGKTIGVTPQDVLKLTNPQAVATKEAVEEIVQRNLRLILGAAFTEKEGERLIARAYNPALSQQENVRRGRLLQSQIFEAAKAKQDAVEFYNQNGTLFGWQGKLFNSTNDFLNEYNKRLSDKDKTPPSDFDGFKIKRIN
jgi:hypothetical protein